MFRPIFGHLTYLGLFNQNDVWTVEGGHHGLSFGTISEKVSDKFLNKGAFYVN